MEALFFLPFLLVGDFSLGLFDFGFILSAGNSVSVSWLSDVISFLLSLAELLLVKLAGVARVGAEGAGEYAHIGGFYVEVAVEVDLAIVEEVGYEVGQCAYEGEFSFFEEQQSLFVGDALVVLYFFCNCQQTVVGAGCPEYFR
jgi:hypothetical protein